MRWRWFRWVIRIGLGFVALLAAGFAALFIRNPDTALIFLLILIQPLIANSNPPAIAKDQLTGVTLEDQANAGRKMTTVLQRKFPAGTSEVTLRSALLNQGFKPLPAPPADCVPSGQQVPLGRIYTPCPTYDRSKMLEYRWSSVICGETITVRWLADDRNDITDVNATYYLACL